MATRRSRIKPTVNLRHARKSQSKQNEEAQVDLIQTLTISTSVLTSSINEEVTNGLSSSVSMLETSIDTGTVMEPVVVTTELEVNPIDTGGIIEPAVVTTELEVNPTDPLAQSIKLQQNPTSDIGSGQAINTTLEHEVNTQKQFRRPLVKPVLNRNILSKIKRKDSIATPQIKASDDSGCVNDSNNVPQEEQALNTQDTSCFDILQADIVIPGIVLKDDENKVSEHVIPAHNEFIVDRNYNNVTDSISNDQLRCDSGVDIESTNTNSKPFRRIMFKPTINKKLLTHRKREPPKLNAAEASINTDLPQEVIFDSHSDTLQLNELEIASSNEQEIPSETEELNTFIKPTVNLKLTKIKKDEHDFNNQKKDESHSDVEQTTSLAPNPVKLFGRNRIKAVPRLGQRRMSSSVYGSASESEDDIKKYKRIRTESASSACGTQELNNEEECMEKVKDMKVATSKKCRRSEQSRKMAEARRNFVHKFGKGVPDKQQLTMMDLIYYNPATEPMSQKFAKQMIDDNTFKVTLQPEPANTTEDNIENVPIKDDDDDIPAPQIKIGINGEIIIDEQSLVIENAQTRKSREALQKSDIVNGDFDTRYGVFKRLKRAKDWSKVETMHFYKALNTIGTDFSLMSGFFHDRTRRDLKMKFKKEERLNSALVDKALSQPPQFDIVELRHDYEKYKKLMEPDLEIEEILKRSTEGLNGRYTRKKPKATSTKTNTNPVHIDSTSEDDKTTKRVIAPLKKKRRKRRSTKMIKLSTNTDNSNSQLSNILKPTRSGRIPKPRQQFNSESLVRQASSSSNTNFPEFKPLQPGSLMIITCPTPSGEPCFKVFMVTENQSKVPISLSADIVNNLTQSTENNVTTPAEGMKVEQSNATTSNIQNEETPTCAANESLVNEKQ